MKTRNAVMKYGAPLVVGVSTFAGAAMATDPDYSGVTGAVSFVAVIAAVGLVYASIGGYKVAVKGYKLLMAALS